MNVALRQPMTLAQFLAWEERQELRYEFDGVRAIAMTGGTAAHAAIQRNLVFSLTSRLRGQRCRPYGSELKIEVAGRVRYPDAFVVCTPVPPRSSVVADPVVIFEVLSPRSTHADFVVKNAECRATPSVQRYAVLQQTHAGATVFRRNGQEWVAEMLLAPDNLEMPEIGISISLAELYVEVELELEADD